MNNISFESIVVKGMGIGRSIGFPTINLEIPESLIMKEGIYACRVKLLKPSAIDAFGALYFGHRKSAGLSGETLEIHLIGDNERLSGVNFDGEKVNVQVIKYIREPRKFASRRELTKAIENDVKLITQMIKEM